MKKTTKRLIVFLVCFVVLLSSVAVIVSARGANVPAKGVSAQEKANSDGTVTTKYGVIPKEYADAEEYPFVIFKFIGGQLSGTGEGWATMAKAFDVAKGHQDKNRPYYNYTDKVYSGDGYRTTVVLMRRDYTTRSGELNSNNYTHDNPGGDQYHNYAQVMGELTLDLNGYTLTQGKGTNGIFYQVTNKAWELHENNPNALPTATSPRGVFRTEYTVINGNLRIDSSPVFYGNMWNCVYVDQAGRRTDTVYNSDHVWMDKAVLLKEPVAKDGGGYYFFKDQNGNPFDAYVRTGKDPNFEYHLIEKIKLSEAKISDKDFYWNFNNVNFGYVQGATPSTGNAGNYNMLMGYTGPQYINTTSPPTVPAPYYFNYTYCTFDLTNAPNGQNITLFNAAPGSNGNNYAWLDITVNVNGSKIVAPPSRLNELTLYKTWEISDDPNVDPNRFVVNFNKDANGDYLALELTDGSKPPVPDTNNNPYDDDDNLWIIYNGEKYYWHFVDGYYALSKCYAVGTQDYMCTCGAPDVLAHHQVCYDTNSNNICDSCGAEWIGGTWLPKESGEDYPFVVLDSSNKFLHQCGTLNRAMNLAKDSVGSTILLRTDHTLTRPDTVDLQNHIGEFKINLNGKTITRRYANNSNEYLFDNWFNGSINPNEVTVKIFNGRFLLEHELICLSGYENMSNSKTVNFDFEDVTFERAANANAVAGWIITVHGQVYNKSIISNITFTNCTFDMTNTNSGIDAATYPALNLDTYNAYGYDRIKVDVTFNGGTIKAQKNKNFDPKAFIQYNSDDTITFNSYNGNYITLMMQGGNLVAPAKDYFKINGNSVYFHNPSNNVYTLSACSDSNSDHKCDKCLSVLSSCYDSADQDHKCDHCNATLACIDNSGDHKCDYCAVQLECKDANKDHVCEVSGERSPCYDTNGDEICDYCGYLYDAVAKKYGVTNIPADVQDTTSYPFFILKKIGENGEYTFVKEATQFYGKQSGSSAIGYSIYTVLKPANVYDIETGKYLSQGDANTIVTENDTRILIVMRRDYELKVEYSESAPADAEYFNNIAHAQGSITVDLGGHTLIEKSGSKSMFGTTMKGWRDGLDGVYTFPTYYTFKNGSVRLRTAFVNLGSNDFIEEYGYDTGLASMNLTIENVKFSTVHNTLADMIFKHGTTVNAFKGVSKANVLIKNCTFDLSSNVPVSPISIVNNTATNKYLGCKVVIEGCEIITSDIAKVTLYKGTSDNGSSVNVGKDDIVLKMPEGSLAPANTQMVILADGQVCSFKKTSNADGYDIYTLAPTVTLDYKIKTNVTLHTNFVYNIYIPSEKVIDFTVTYGGKTYTKSGTTEKNGYYVVNIELPIAESLSDIAVEVTLNSGSTTTANLSYTLGILKYAESILAGSYLEMSKTLVKDMLVYAYNAHKYFGVNSSDIAANLTKVESMLNSYYRGLPTDVAVNTVSDTYFESVTLDLGRKPAYRFYLNNEYTINDFTFTIGGTEVNAIPGTEDEKSYLEIKVPAYDMLGGVSYTVTDKTTKKAVTETYNVVAYYNGMIADKPAVGSGDFADYAERVSLVEGLMKYSDSARTYKSYIGNNGFGSMSIVVPETVYANHIGADVTALFTNGAYYGNVTWTTDNSHVYVVDSKIYAVGTFANNTQVTVTATTEHHSVSKTITVTNYAGNDILAIPGAALPNPSMQAGGKKLTDASGNALTNNYVVMGKLNVSKISSIPQPHIQFKLADKYRFLILDNDTDHIFGAGYQAGDNNYVHDTTSGEEYDGRGGTLAFDWTVVVKNDVAYFYVNDVLKQTMTAPKKGFEYFEIGGLYMDMCFSDMKVYTEDNAGYTDRLQLLHHNMVSNSHNITDTGMYVDANGNITKDKDKNPLTTNYVAKGVLTIYSTNTGDEEDGVYQDPHLQFHLGSRLRFLIWDNDRDGWLGDGYEQANPDGSDASQHFDDTELGEKYNAANGAVTLEWAVIVVGNTAYYYVNGTRVATITETSTKSFTHFNIGALSMNVVLYDIEACTEADDAETYNAYLEKYKLA